MAARRGVAVVLVSLVASAVVAGAAVSLPADEAVVDARPPRAAPSAPTETPQPARTAPPAPRGAVTLGFAGDVHFERHVAMLLDGPRGDLGPIARQLRRPDVTMVNLEAAVTSRGTPEQKLFTFRTPPKALDVLTAAGVDVVTVANNHGIDYGPVGLRDTLAAKRRSPVPVVGVGRNAAEAFAPHRMRVGRTRLAFFGVSQAPDDTPRTWSARPDRPGLATAVEPHERLLAHVRAADARREVVVVYLHWGEERATCPSPKQRRMAVALARAGADVLVGSHAHMLQGAGWLGRTYVSYGLGNFVWYNTYRPDSGVLTVRLEDGEAVGHSFAPAVIREDGRPYPLVGEQRRQAVSAWRELRGCAGLAAAPPSG